MILIDILKIWRGRGVPLGTWGYPLAPDIENMSILDSFWELLEPLWIPSVSLGTLKMRKNKKTSGPWRRLGTLPGKC